MSITQTTSQQSQPGNPRCTRCHIVLPTHAAFCGNCGERVEKSLETPLPRNHADVAENYRITSLLRRSQYVQLFLALDIKHPRPVVLRDINISSLDEDERAEALEATKYEYDLLHNQGVRDVMPMVDLRYSRNHLYVIASVPSSSMWKEVAEHNTIPTLQDLLQSGIGLPDEQIAITWGYRLSRALAGLHNRQIVIGDLDPHAIIISEESYDGLPALVPSWLPTRVRDLLPRALNILHASRFVAPEARHGSIDPRSDIYSLGAILYLLLTGVAPDEPGGLRSPRELNSRVSSNVDALVSKALASDSADRFQSAGEMSELLLELCSSTKIAPRPPTASPRPTRQLDKANLQQKTTDVYSRSWDNTIEDSKKTPSIKGPDDATILIVPHQTQLERWRMSKTKTRNLRAQAKQVAGTVVERKPLQERATRETEADIKRSQEQDKQPSSASEVSSEHSAELDNAKTQIDLDESGDFSTGDEPDHQTTLDEIKVEDEHPSKPILPETTVDIEHLNTITFDKTSFQDHQSSDTAINELEVVDTTSTTQPVEIPWSDLSARQAEEAEKQEDTPEIPEQRIRRIEEVPTVIVKSAALGLPLDDDLSEALAEAAVEEDEAPPKKESAAGRLREMITGKIPVLPRLVPSDSRSAAQRQLVTDKTRALLKLMQRFILGEQRHDTTAAALIETPLRIQPKQGYSIRIHLMGRNEPGEDVLQREAEQKDSVQAGLSSLITGDTVHIEVRSALFQNYAYIVQRADVQLPSNGYAAEVTIPMQPLSNGPSGRRERLHIFFMDEQHRPLYEKPFVVEVYISHLVQAGREGHNVLTIPI